MMKTYLMNYFMLMMAITTLLIMMNNNHPILMILNLITYTMMVCMIMSTWTFNFIYSIMMFLIMISGLLIIFLYFSSLVSNEQNKIKINKITWMNMFINLSLLFYSLYLTTSFPSLSSQENQSLFNMNSHTFSNIFKIYNYPFSNLTLLCMLFLLISLIMIIKICSIKTSPLRKIS